jgi:hypothetical protein
MKPWTEELAQVEAAALRIEALEVAAESRFDQARLRAANEDVVGTPEFADWMAARADTDAAWGRWAQVMDARPDMKKQGT